MVTPAYSLLFPGQDLTPDPCVALASCRDQAQGLAKYSQGARTQRAKEVGDGGAGVLSSQNRVAAAWKSPPGAIFFQPEKSVKGLEIFTA